MDLTSPLSSLIPTLDAVVLEVLAGTQGALGTSKVHRLGRRGSRQGVANALDRLVEHGIVLAEPSNHGAMYRLNRAHILTSAVLHAADARSLFLRRLSGAISTLSPTPVSASLFGSVARNESTLHSDIDVLIVVADDEDGDPDGWTAQLYDLAIQVEAWTGNHLETITHSLAHLAELVQAGEPIVGSWREDAVTLLGTDIRTILDETGPRSLVRSS